MDKGTINRQDAIDAIKNTYGLSYIEDGFNRQDAVSIIENLPSAQQEIVRCKDCKHIRRWRSEEAARKFGQAYECAYGVFRAPHTDDFCSKAERREE